MLVALVFAAGELPWILFGFLAGKLTDRLDRRRLATGVAMARTAMLVLLAALILAGLAPLWLVVTAAFVLGVGEVLADNVSGTLVPLLVAPDDLERANSRMVGATIAGNELIGPAIGGLLFAVGASLPFFTNASLLAGAVILLAGLPILDEAPGHATDVVPRAFDGIPFLRNDPLLRTLTWSGAALAAVDAAWFAVLVLFVRNELGYGAAGFGAFLAVGAIGGLGGAALADRWPRVRLTTVSASAFAATAASLILLGLWPSPVATAFVLVVTSAAFAVWNVFMVSARQRATPNSMLGRVGAAYRTVVVSASLLGALAGGLLADVGSLSGALVVYGLALALLTPVVGWRFSKVAE